MSKIKRKAAFDFEKNLKELEEILEQMEQGDITLEVSVEYFSRAMHLLENCQITLKQAKQKVKILLNKAQKDTLVTFDLG